MSKENEVLTKHEVAKQVSERMGISVVDAAEVFQTALDVMVEHIINGGRIEIRNFGVFEVKMRKAGVGRNPHDPDKQIPIPPRMGVKFHPGKNIAKALAKKK